MNNSPNSPRNSDIHPRSEGRPTSEQAFLEHLCNRACHLTPVIGFNPFPALPRQQTVQPIPSLPGQPLPQLEPLHVSTSSMPKLRLTT